MVGVAAQLLAHPGDFVVIAGSGRRDWAPLVLWERPVAVFAAASAELPRAVAERIESLAASLASAWLAANGG